MSREIKFRLWNGAEWLHVDEITLYDLEHQPKGWVFQQYTGLKDKNGVEIYEGDIVEYSGSLMYVIEWDDLYMKFKTSTITNQDGMYELTTGQLKQSNIIGNIFENPELLKS